MRHIMICIIASFCLAVPGATWAQGVISADFDNSGAVDLVDFSRFATRFALADSTGSDVGFDLNNDRLIDGEDAFLFADVFSDNSSEPTLTTSTGPNTGVKLRIDPDGNGFLIYLEDIVRIGGYRILFTVPDTVSVSKVHDYLGIGMLPVKRTTTGVEIVGLVLGNKPIENAGLIAKVTFKGDTTGVAVSGVHLRGTRVSLGNHVFLGDRNTVASTDISRVALGDLHISHRVFDFGHLPLGQIGTRTFSLQNTFDAQQAPGTSRNLAFEITTSGPEVAVDPQIFGVLADTSTGLTTGATQEIKLTFNPMQPGPFWGYADIETNRSERKKIRVHVMARVHMGSADLRRVVADFDTNGTVDYGDFQKIIGRFGTAPDSAKFDLDGDGVINGVDAFLFSDVLGGGAGLALLDTVHVTSGINQGAAVRVQGSGENFTVSVRDLSRLGGYRIVLDYNPEDVDLRWAHDLSGGGLLPINKTATGAEIVSVGLGSLIESPGDFALAEINVRALKGQTDPQALVSVSKVFLRGMRGERDSVDAVRIASNGLDASPRVIDFGDLRLGAVSEKTFRIYNLNSSSTSFEIASSDSLVKTSPRSVGNLGAGRFWDVKVTYTSTTPGPFASTLMVSAIGDDPSPLTLNVKSFGTVVSIAPDSLAFGSIFLGQNQTQTLTLTNPDLTAFNIENISLSGVDTNFVVDPTLDLPLSVSGEGGSQSIGIRFNPLVRGEIRDTLFIAGADTNFVVPLSGRGLERAAMVDIDFLDFGSVTQGQDSTLQVVISNTGNVTYRLDSLSIGKTDSSFSASGLSFPDTMLTADSDTLLVRFAPDTTGAKVDTLRLYGQDSLWIIPLAGTGLPKPIVEPPPLEDIVFVTFGGTITKSREQIHFGRVAWGVTDTAKVRVRNNRGGNLTFRFSATDSQVSVKPDSVQNLPPNQEWDVVITFTATDSIQTASAFQITTDEVGDGTTSIELISGGSNPVVSDATLDFSAIGLDLSLTQSMTVTNTGHSQLVIESIGLGDDSTFVLVEPPTLPLGIAADGAAHTFQVRFNPKVRGTFLDTLVFAATDTAFSVAVTGIGRESKLTVAPDSIGFGLVRVGVSDTTDMVLTNVGGDTLFIDDLSLLAAGTPISVLGLPALPDTLIPNGGERRVSVVFAPTAAVVSHDTLRIVAGLDTTLVPIAGTGTVAQASISVTELDFGNVAMGRILRDTVTVSNTGNVPFELSGVSLGAGNAWFTLLESSVDAIAVNGSATFVVGFEPDSTGTRADVLNITGVDTAFSVTLRGIGVPSVTVTYNNDGVAVVPVRLDFGVLSAGDTKRRIVRVVNAASAPLTFTTTLDDAGLSVRPSSLTALPTDQSWDLVVDWSPSESSTLLTALHIASDTPIVIPVGRQGVFAELLTDSLAFGDFRLGTDTTQVIRMRNTGQGLVVVNAIELLGGTESFTLPNAPTLPATLSEGDSLRVPVRFDPLVAGHLADTVRITSADTVFTIPLLGRGIQPIISLNTDLLDFGDRVSGTDSTFAVIIQNTGNGPFVVDSLKFVSQPEFTVSNAPTLPSTLGGGGGADTVFVRFAPLDLGSYTGQLTLFGEGQQWVVSLTGVSTVTGVAGSDVVVAFGPTITLSDSTLRFGNIPNGSTRKLSFVIRNDRDSTFAFNITSNDPQVSVSPGSVDGLLQAQFTTVEVSFTPVVNGPTRIDLNITTNAPADGTVNLAVEKNRPPVFVSPWALDFGEVIVGSRDSLDVVITNPEILNYVVTGLAIQGGQRSAFQLRSSPALPDTVRANGKTRSLSVIFEPALRGQAVDTLLITGLDTSFAVTLAGTGLFAQASVDTTELNFGSLLFGQDSIQTVTVSNVGDIDLPVLGVTIVGDHFVLPDAPVLPDTLRVGAQQMIRVGFAPTVSGDLIGALQIDVETQTLEVALSGVGKAPPRIAPGPIALDLDATPGDQGVRLNNEARGQITIDLAITEGALGTSGFQAILAFDPATITFGEFAVADLFEGATPIVQAGENQVEINVLFFGTETAQRDSGSAGTVIFGLAADSSQVALVSGQFAFSTGPVDLEIGPEGALVTLIGSAQPNPDFNGDGSVDFTDFIAFAGAFGTTLGEPGYNPIYDLDGDDAIGFGDFIVFAGAFGQGGSKPVAKPALDTEG